MGTHNWFKENLSTIENHVLENPPNYSSEQLKVDLQKVQGICYQVKKIKTDMADSGEFLKVIDGQIKML